jgi:hypothetical protein
MRFRSAWLETGKGQAKSPLMAAVGLYMAGFYGIARAKVFAIGQDKNTANVLFKDAVAMCRGPIPPAPGEEVDASDTLVSRGAAVIRGEGDNAWKIEFGGEGDNVSIFQSLSRTAKRYRARSRRWSLPTRSTNSRRIARSSCGRARSPRCRATR